MEISKITGIQSQTLQAYSFLLILQFHFTGTSYDLVLSDVKIPGMNEWL
jgi:hypothetical protein